MSQGRRLLRPFADSVVYAPTGDEAAAFDARAIDVVGVPQPVLMENAGRSAAQVVARLFPRGRVVGFVGSGNNGGDALVLLRTLAAWGRDVSAVYVADRAGAEPLTHGWALASVLGEDMAHDEAAWTGLTSDAALIVDGILGTGVRGAPRERQAAAIRRVNRSGRPVLSIDIPSGVHAGTGQVAGEAVKADVTVSFGAPKLGTLLHPGRAHSGRVVAVEIGFPPMEPAEATAQVITPSWAQARLPVRALDTHKNAVGRVLVVAGGGTMAGAAVLSARGALRAGAGLVQVCSPPSNREILQSAVPEAIYVDSSDELAVAEAVRGAGAVAVGPGLGTDEAAGGLLRRVLSEGSAPSVLDADALTLMAEGGPGSIERVAAIRPVLVTPHLGEMARLTHMSGDELASDRVSAAQAAAAEWKCTVLLKGAPSIVAGGGLPVLVDTQGSSDLAAAGMGDVLAGVAGAFLAQGLGPREAGAVALYVTGRAANASDLGPSLTPVDVVEMLPEAMAERGPGSSDLDFRFVVFDQDAAS